MNFNQIISELQQASLFDLYRLHAAIGKRLDDPSRLQALKRQLKPGMDITYFHVQENRLIAARILEIRKTRVTVKERDTGKRWTIPLYTINLQSTDTDISPQRGQVDRLSLKIGDSVGFKCRDGQEIFGTVVKLNPKRAKVKTRYDIWAVPYSLLFRVIDGEQGGHLVISAKR
jgi:hypothetical protein